MINKKAAELMSMDLIELKEEFELRISVLEEGSWQYMQTVKYHYLKRVKALVGLVVLFIIF